MSQLLTTESIPPSGQERTSAQPSPDQLQTALCSGLTAVWFLDLANNSLHGDPAFLTLLSIDPTAGSPPTHVFTDVIHPDDRQRVINLIEEARTNHTFFEAGYRLVLPGTESKWFFARGQFVYNQDQEPVTFSGILINVTDRKQMELKAQMAEEKLRLAVESTQLGTWDCDLITWDLTWSDRTTELLGLPADSLVSYTNFIQALHPDDRDATNKAFREAVQSVGDGHFQHEYRTMGLNNGQPRWLRSSGRVIFNDEHVACRFIGTVVDITTDKQNEAILQQRVSQQTQALEQQAHQLRTTLDAAMNSIISLTAIRDEQGTIVDFLIDTANRAVAYSVFMTAEELVGQTLLTVFPGKGHNNFIDMYIRVAETGQSEHVTRYYQDEKGLNGWFEVSAFKPYDNRVVITFDNITDRKNNELFAQQQAAELNAANIELKRSNESLQQFAHIASHDLQEPLRRIQSFSDMLHSQFADSLSDGEKDMVRRIQKSAGRMQSLVKDLLSYSQLSTQRDSFATVSLTDVVDDVLNDLEMVIIEKKASVKVSELPKVRGNVSRLRQLFQNLIANALKFSPAGVNPVISVDWHKAQPNELPEALQTATGSVFGLISVKDNGIGFDVRYKDRVFTPFQRLHNTASYGGTGIGLAICQRVTQNHGGDIDVDSEVGKGSTFKIFLPVIA